MVLKKDGHLAKEKVQSWLQVRPQAGLLFYLGLSLLFWKRTLN